MQAVVGVVRQLYRYPVKSMCGEALESAELVWSGLLGDRRFAFVRAGNHSRFPWLTARELPQLQQYHPRFVELTNAGNAVARVTTPGGADLALDDEQLCAELAAQFGAPLYLMQSGRGMPDTASVSLLGLATVEALSAELGMTLEPLRFRPNIVVELTDQSPFAEEGWLGGLLTFGERADSAQVRVNRKDPRCMMVNLDPTTSTQNPQVLRKIVRERDSCLGVYGSVEAIGTIAVGDTITLSQ